MNTSITLDVAAPKKTAPKTPATEQAPAKTVSKLTAEQAKALYTVALALTPAEAKPNSASGQAHKANTENGNMARCLIMNNALKGASKPKQQTAMDVVQKALDENKQAMSVTQAKALVKQVAEQAGLNNRASGKPNPTLGRNYTVMAMQRIAAGL